MKQLTDEELMHNLSSGDLDAMAFLYNRYRLRIYNFIFQMTRNKDVAEDLTQNVFYKVIKNRTTYNGGKFVSWIFKIARNIFSDHYQKQQLSNNNLSLERIGNTILSTDSSSSDDYEHLYAALNHLKVHEHELIVLSRMQGLTYKRIAEITNSTEGSIKVKIYRIIKKLRTLYFEKL